MSNNETIKPAYYFYRNKPDCYNCELSYCDNLQCLKALTPEIVYQGASDILKD